MTPGVAVTEADFQLAVVQLARVTGWLSYHTHDSRRSAAGFPDLVFVKPPRVVIVELKSEKGKTKPEQDLWIAAFAGCPGVEMYLWRPSDWPEVLRTLQGPPKAVRS